MTCSDKEFLGTGWAFPLEVDPDTGRVAQAQGEQDIEQSIYIILSTSRGDRVMRPDFGCGIHDLAFEVINTALVTNIRQTVTESLRQFEPRIEVERVEVDTRKAYQGLLRIELHYQNRVTNQSGNYVYPFYLNEVS